MADFIAVIQPDLHAEHGSVAASQAIASQGPAPEGMRWLHQPWGRIALRENLWREVAAGEESWHIAGRPSLRGGGSIGLEHLAALRSAEKSYSRLSGIFLITCLTESGLELWTDRMSHMAAYIHARPDGSVLVSSSVELTARHASLQLDEVSLAELLLWDCPTFPHTTRVGVQQLAPGSRHLISATADGVRVECVPCWKPREPERSPSKSACIDAAIESARESAREIATGASTLGIMLSGGLDSRIVAAELKRHTDVEAFTFLDQHNRESAAAARTAEALGIKHHLVFREPDYYAHAFDEGQRLIGFEQNSIPCHALCLRDTPEVARLDALVGGFGCDILMKGAYVPYAMNDLVLARWGVRSLAPSRRIGKHNYSHAHKRFGLIRDDLVQAALARRDGYERQLREFRPTTAEEWIGFYPISQTTSIDSATADRAFVHDEFFFHAGLVEASAITPQVWKKGLDVITAMGKALAPGVAELPHPDSGLPATTRYYRERILRKLGQAKPQANRASPARTEADVPSWYSDGSFIKYASFFADAPAWIERREAAFADESAVETLSGLLTVDPREVLGSGESRYGSLINAMAVQLLRLCADTAAHSTAGLERGSAS